MADPTVFHVAPAPAGVDNGWCTAAAPCATLSHALSRVPSGGRIQVAAGWYAGTVTVPPGLQVSIQGAGQDQTIIDGQRGGSVVTVKDHAVLNLTGVTVTNGSSRRGGGIYIRGAVSLIHSRVVFNWASEAGGGIFSGGDLDIVGSTIAANEAKEAGGGILAAGRLTMTASAVVRNTLARAGDNFGGGGIYASGGSAVISDSTIADNEAPSGYGGGIAVSVGALTARHLTITGNVADSGSGISAYESTVRMDGSVLQNSGQNCRLVRASVIGSYNLDTDGTCGLRDHPIAATEARLGPLADNGGPTLTRATTGMSPARAAIPAAHALCDGTDQRSVLRRYLNSTGCDVGAFQLPTAGALAVSASAVDFGVQTVGTASVRSLTVSNAGGSPLRIAEVSIAGGGYKVKAAGCTISVVLVPGSSCQLEVLFGTTFPGERTGKLTIVSDAPTDDGVAAVMLAGQGTAVPVNVVPPTVNGDHVRGNVLVADLGTWVGIEEISYTYEWLRCSPAHSACEDEPVAEKDTYQLTKDDVGWQIILQVTAKNPAGTTVAASALSPVVKR